MPAHVDDNGAKQADLDAEPLLEIKAETPSVETPVKPTPPKAKLNVQLAVLAMLAIQNSAIILTMKQSSRITASDGRNSLTSTTVAVVSGIVDVFCTDDLLNMILIEFSKFLELGGSCQGSCVYCIHCISARQL